MVEADGAPLTAGAVLLHTVPRSVADVDAEEAVWCQYNSCVDFSFQEGRGNAREFLRTGNSNPERESRHDRFIGISVRGPGFGPQKALEG